MTIGRARRLGRPTTDIAILKRARRRRLAQPGKQHEAGERRGAGRRSISRPASASGSAPTAPPATTTSTCSRRCGRRRSCQAGDAAIRRAVQAPDGARHGDDRRGARARDGAARIGSLEAGKRADLIIVVGMRQARQTPLYDAGVAPRLRHARRRCADDDRQRQDPDARSAADDAERDRGARPTRARRRIACGNGRAEVTVESDVNSVARSRTAMCGRLRYCSA